MAVFRAKTAFDIILYSYNQLSEAECYNTKVFKNFVKGVLVDLKFFSSFFCCFDVF